MHNNSDITELALGGRPVLYVASDEHHLENIKAQISFLVPQVEVLLFPAWNTSPYDISSPNSSVLCERNTTLAKLAIAKKEVVILASTKSIMQKIPQKEDIEGATLFLSVGSKYNREKLIHTLIEACYERSEIAEKPGEFAVRGSIIDIVSQKGGYRADFFGSEISSIKKFDTLTQLSSTKVTSIHIPSASEILLSPANINKFKERYLKRFGVTQDPIYHSLANGSKCEGMENFLPLFFDKTTSIFSYLPSNTQVITDSLSPIFASEYWQEIEDNYKARLSVKSSSPLLEPSELYINPEELSAILSTNNAANYKPKVQPFSPSISSILKEETHKISKLRDYVQNNDRKIIIACDSPDSLAKIENFFQKQDIVTKQISNHSGICEIPEHGIGISLLEINKGFESENYALLAENEIFKGSSKTPATKVKGHKRFLQEVSNLHVDDLVVHNEYGIGRFKGLSTLTIQNIVRDFVEITYLDNDKLYLPVENLEVISRYGENQSDVQLDKLGANSWKLRKAKLKEKIKLAAEALIKTAAIRESREGLILSPIPELYEKFCKNFPFIETPDQEIAIGDVLKDMRSGKPMDRLICGDVGFGKTEVALRAASAAVLSDLKVQVAIIAPTTLLSRQHFKTFQTRFKDLPINVKQLSKFTPRSELKSIKEGIASGGVDIVIGTHSLLAKDIKFNNLSLLVIDEEQHFGVAQKEKLKELKEDVHLLYLSATPIPRTLQMSLVDIKSLSLITTPPVDKKPVNTIFSSYDPIKIKDAITREKEREGRVFYVTPRVSYLDEIFAKLTRLVPEAKIVMAHGGMSASVLDKSMNDFYDGKYDILLSTSIVESGLDIPMANTLIIDRAHMFGLAQLYQIRGRIGRSKASAYAYLTIPDVRSITPQAKKRLEVLQRMNYLGAGFNVASCDLDIRGYGNLLGEEQSGQIKEVGVELYHSMLEDAVNKLTSDEIEKQEEWSPVINLGLSIQIPNTYISCDSLRLSTYRQIAAIQTREELDSFSNNLVDRFGPLPEQVQHLFSIIKVKQIAKKAGISKVDMATKGLVISFHNNKAKDPDFVISLVQKNPSIKLRPDGKLLFLQDLEKKDKVQVAISMLGHFVQPISST